MHNATSLGWGQVQTRSSFTCHPRLMHRAWRQLGQVFLALLHFATHDHILMCSSHLCYCASVWIISDFGPFQIFESGCRKYFLNLSPQQSYHLGAQKKNIRDNQASNEVKAAHSLLYIPFLVLWIQKEGVTCNHKCRGSLQSFKTHLWNIVWVTESTPAPGQSEMITQPLPVPALDQHRLPLLPQCDGSL